MICSACETLRPLFRDLNRCQKFFFISYLLPVLLPLLLDLGSITQLFQVKLPTLATFQCRILIVFIRMRLLNRVALSRLIPKWQKHSRNAITTSRVETETFTSHLVKFPHIFR